MNKDYLVRVLVLIVLALLLYNTLKPDGNQKYLDAIKKENKELSEQIRQSQLIISNQIDSITTIKQKETIIRNYYNEIISEIDNVTSDSVIVSIIREQLSKLGAARFD